MTPDAKIAERINILFVSPSVPYPMTDGGKIRVLNLIRRLCRIHKVTLLAFVASPADEQGAEYLREMGVEVVGVKFRHPKLVAALHGLLQNFTQGKPLIVAKYYSTEMVRALANLLRSRRFDIVHFEMLHTGQYLLELRAKGRGQREDTRYKTQDTRQGEEASSLESRVLGLESSKPYATVLGEQNIDSSIWRMLARAEPNPLRKLIFYWQYRSFMGYESRICHHFDTCICVSAEDKRRLVSLCSEATVELVPNGVDPDYFRPGKASEFFAPGAAALGDPRLEYAAGLFEESETRLVFTGSMDWYPNEDAALHFCDCILPLIRDELPDIKFYIVGSNPTSQVLKLRRINGVIVTGSVEDVRPYVAGATVYVVPLRIGGGTRLKILQALAMGKAVVSTSIGCEGLNLQQDKHLLVADEPRQFANAVARLVKSGSLQRRLGENGRKLILSRYDWNIIVRELDLVYRGLISF